MSSWARPITESPIISSHRRCRLRCRSSPLVKKGSPSTMPVSPSVSYRAWGMAGRTPASAPRPVPAPYYRLVGRDPTSDPNPRKGRGNLTHHPRRTRSRISRGTGFGLPSGLPAMRSPRSTSSTPVSTGNREPLKTSKGVIDPDRGPLSVVRWQEARAPRPARHTLPTPKAACSSSSD